MSWASDNSWGEKVERLRRYIQRAARWRALSAFRRSPKLLLQDSADELPLVELLIAVGPEPGEEVEATDFRMQLLTLLRRVKEAQLVQLSPQQSKIYDLWLSGFDLDEIAATLGTTYDNVKTQRTTIIRSVKSSLLELAVRDEPTAALLQTIGPRAGREVSTARLLGGGDPHAAKLIKRAILRAQLSSADQQLLALDRHGVPPAVAARRLKMTERKYRARRNKILEKLRGAIGELASRDSSFASVVAGVKGN